jgi:hypothetical protein
VHALQAQVGDIGVMGAPAKLDGKAVEGVKLFLGGKIGENPEVRPRGDALVATLSSGKGIWRLPVLCVGDCSAFLSMYA